MIGFEHPEAFALPVIAAVLLWRRMRGQRPAVLVLRALLLLVLASLLAGPFLPLGEPGRDLVLVVDRSKSMPAQTLADVQELAQQVVAQRRAGDRIGMVVFGKDAVVESPPRADWRYAPQSRTVDDDGTDLALALQKALALVPPGRRATLLVLSDGETTGGDAADVARAALRAGVRIDARVVRRTGGLDVAVEDVATPGQVAMGEPFQFSAFVRADVAGEVPIRLLRDGVVIAEGRRALQVGKNRLTFRDCLQDPGVHRYEVEVDPPADRVVENNRARAVVRVTGPFRVLCLTPGGREDRLTRSLVAAGIDVVVRAPANAPLALDALDGFGAVLLEDVPAEDLTAGAMQALAGWVRDLGGGLMMTGGAAAYGPGGYHRSRIEEVLPVSMEIREEQRKHALAMAIALDRSGSMAATVGGGVTKMELADRGTCAAIELLGRSDSVAVLAVDSAPHVVVPLTPVTDKPGLTDRVLSIESMGGGIYVEAALLAAANELVDARQGTKHIVLFADAADAEEPGSYRELVPRLVRAGVTVSVIGLGSDKDTDAALLEEIAKLGNGRCFFVADPADLPRVFAQETIQMARASMVEEQTSVSVLPDVLALGALAEAAFPDVGGYSIAYLKDRAQVGLVTADDNAAPLFSFWQCGLGRAAAFLGEVDGPLTGPLGTWAGFGGFFTTTVRWLAGSEADELVYAELDRAGHEGVLSVEVEAGREALLGKVRGRVLLPDGSAREVPLVRAGDRRLVGRFPLAGEGVYRGAVDVAGTGEVARVPPITLPYSPEFERRLDPDAGMRELARITEIAEGRLDPPTAELFAGSRDSVGSRPLAPLLAWVVLALLLTEIAVRRLALSLPRVRLRLPSPRRPAASTPTPTPAGERGADPRPAAARQQAPAPPERDIGGILARTKARADRRLNR